MLSVYKTSGCENDSSIKKNNKQKQNTRVKRNSWGQEQRIVIITFFTITVAKWEYLVIKGMAGFEAQTWVVVPGSPNLIAQ